jgi:membrane protein
MPTSSGFLELGKQVVSDFSEKNVTFMAAGIAYNAFVSLAPLLILLLLLVSIVGSGLEDRLVTAAGNALPGPIADVVIRIFSEDTGATGASIVGLVVLIWGTLKIFRGLDTAFSEIYETEQENTFVDQLVDGLVVLVALVGSIVATVAVSTVFTTFSDAIPVFGFLTPVVLFAGLVIAFFPIFYRFPDTDVSWKDVLPGTLLAAFGWAGLQAVFQVYLVFKGTGSESFFGGVLVVVTWLYFSGLLLLLGAVLNAVIGGHSSGAPGGVGRGAARDDSDTATRRSLERNELASYLRDLRTRLTGHSAVMEPAAEPTETDRRLEDGAEIREIVGTLRKRRPISLPDDEVEVIERSSPNGDQHTKTVTLRWRTTDSERAE